MPQFDEKVVQRYLKVLAHVERGTGPEREAAVRVLSSLEAKHPGIREEADRIRRASQGEQEGPRSWEDFFTFLGEMYSGVSGAVRAAMAGVRLARTVNFTRTTRVGGTYLSVRIPTRTIMEVQQLEPAQREIFRAELMQQFDTELRSLIDS